MLHDPETREAVGDFLRNAAHDFFEATWLMTSPMDSGDGSGYLLQQALENCVKAFLTWNDQPFPLSHDLAKLGSICGSIDPELSRVLAPVSTITFFAGGGRYRRPKAGHSREEMHEYHKSVETAIKSLHERLPKDLTDIYYQYLAEGRKFLP